MPDLHPTPARIRLLRRATDITWYGPGTGNPTDLDSYLDGRNVTATCRTLHNADWITPGPQALVDNRGTWRLTDTGTTILRTLPVVQQTIPPRTWTRLTERPIEIWSGGARPVTLEPGRAIPATMRTRAWADPATET